MSTPGSAGVATLFLGLDAGGSGAGPSYSEYTSNPKLPSC